MNKLDEMTQAHGAMQPDMLGRTLIISQLFDSVDCDTVGAFADLLLSARQTGNAIFFIGNGESAATARISQTTFQSCTHRRRQTVSRNQSDR